MQQTLYASNKTVNYRGKMLLILFVQRSLLKQIHDDMTEIDLYINPYNINDMLAFQQNLEPILRKKLEQSIGLNVQELTKKFIKKSNCCAKQIINKNGITCLDCSKQNNSVYCSDCFNKMNQKHINHRVIITKGLQGVCDCGDSAYLKSEGFCPDHQNVNEDMGDDTSIISLLDSNLVQALRRSYHKYFRSLFQWIDKEYLTIDIRRLYFSEFICPLFKIILSQITDNQPMIVLLYDIMNQKSNFELSHDCQNIQANVILPDNQKQTCSCTIIELLIKNHLTFMTNPAFEEF